MSKQTPEVVFTVLPEHGKLVLSSVYNSLAHLSNIFDEAGRHVAELRGNDDPVQWEIVSMVMNSPPVVRAIPVDGSDLDMATEQVTEFSLGMGSIIGGEGMPSWITPKTRAECDELGRVLSNDGLSRIEVASHGTKLLEIGRDFGKHLAITSAPSKKPQDAYLSISGVLYMLMAKKGGTGCSARIAMDSNGATLACTVPGKLRDVMKSAWTKRVSVFGRVSFDGKRPKTMAVYSCRVLDPSVANPLDNLVGLDAHNFDDSSDVIAGAQ